MTELTPRQIRALILLLILAPLIPTTLLVRLALVTAGAEQAAAQLHSREVYQEELRAGRTSLAKANLVCGSDGELARKILETVQRDFASDSAVAVRIVDGAGQYLAGPNSPAKAPLAEITLGEELRAFRVQLLPAAETEPRVSEQFAGYVSAAAIGLLVNLAIALVAGFALNRQMRLQEVKVSTLATVSHELKTPLASMRMLLDTLAARGDPSPEQVRDYLGLISTENRRLIKITENFLTAARLERGSLKLDPAPTSVADLLQEAAAAISPLAEPAQVQLSLQAPPELPMVSVDRDAIGVALANLLDNALKYSGDSKRIALRAHAAPGRVVIEITDNGIGIAPAEHRKIFARFYQADQMLSRRHEGCGLGLSIVKSIVEAHGGAVHVRSETGAGATFIVELPALPQAI